MAGICTLKGEIEPVLVASAKSDEFYFVQVSAPGVEIKSKYYENNIFCLKIRWDRRNPANFENFNSNEMFFISGSGSLKLAGEAELFVELPAHERVAGLSMEDFKCDITCPGIISIKVALSEQAQLGVTSNVCLKSLFSLSRDVCLCVSFHDCVKNIVWKY